MGCLNFKRSPPLSKTRPIIETHFFVQYLFLKKMLIKKKYRTHISNNRVVYNLLVYIKQFNGLFIRNNNYVNTYCTCEKIIPLSYSNFI